MSGHYDFEEVIRDITPERRVHENTMWAESSETMPLREIRNSLGLTQKDLAEIMEVNQPAIAKLENRRDMRISNLRRYIEALGGSLGIVAKFPQGEVHIDLRSNLD